MVKIGMMIGDRYEVLEKIGTGGMSDVYKAKCHKLNRLVAIKVLKQEFSENANFVSKFKVEAQAAAGLMHPNIVNVYDVGEENGINYIVMELVEGITLKKYIEKKARLSVKEAVTIAIQIGMGIEAAHNNHIIHRDIKPQNVIISKEGKVKVTDFGIAKAATSNTITSNVMGSVHYTSPEQARGGYSDEKSDIYSLGITLFEMLTGRVPFNGDTTVAIAIKQIQEEMPSPREFVSEIPISVEQIVLKCTQKSPDRRYQTMGELIDDLKKSFLTPDEDFVKIKEQDEFAETRTITGDDLESLKKVAFNTGEITGNLPRVESDNNDEYDTKMEKATTILAIAVGILICIIAIFLIGKTIGVFKLGKTNTSVSEVSVSEEKVDQVIMPDVTLMSYKKAEEVLTSNGLSMRLSWEESDDYDKDLVIRTSIKDGLKVDVGTEIVVYVSSGKTSVTVPDVLGYSLNAANKAIMDKGLSVEISYDYSSEVKEGFIISQMPEGGEKAPTQSTVEIIVSKGEAEELVLVPSVLGTMLEEAVAELIEQGFEVGEVTEVYNNIYAEGYVCYQNINYGTEVEKGTTLDIQVSKGPEPVPQETYSYSSSILPPSSTEDPDYAATMLSGNVKISIKLDNGKEIFYTETTSFPVAVNFNNITGSETGTITLTYDLIEPRGEENPGSDAENPTEGAEEDKKPSTGNVTLETVTKTITREITFTKD